MKPFDMVLVAAAAVATLALVDVAALPTFVVRIPNGGNVPGVLAVGHLDPMGSNKLMNSFGNSFKRTRRYWNATLCVTDSDGDGQTNGQELGDPCCLWTNETNSFPAFTVGVSDPGNNKSMVDPTILAKYLPCPADSPAVIYALPPATTAPPPATTAPAAPATTAPTPATTAPTPATTAPVPATTAPTPATTTPTAATTAPTPGTTAPRPTTTAPSTTTPCPLVTQREEPLTCAPGTFPPTKQTKPTKGKWVKSGGSGPIKQGPTITVTRPKLHQDTNDDSSE